MGPRKLLHPTPLLLVYLRSFARSSLVAGWMHQIKLYSDLRLDVSSRLGLPSEGMSTERSLVRSRFVIGCFAILSTLVAGLHQDSSSEISAERPLLSVHFSILLDHLARDVLVMGMMLEIHVKIGLWDVGMTHRVIEAQHHVLEYRLRSIEDMPIDLDDVVREFYHHMSEVRIDRIVMIETVQRCLEADQLIAKG
ncbi:hypothetical protein Tco_1163459 [Tanacetum coccineum]